MAWVGEMAQHAQQGNPAAGGLFSGGGGGGSVFGAASVNVQHAQKGNPVQVWNPRQPQGKVHFNPAAVNAVQRRHWAARTQAPANTYFIIAHGGQGKISGVGTTGLRNAPANGRIIFYATPGNCLYVRKMRQLLSTVCSNPESTFKLARSIDPGLPNIILPGQQYPNVVLSGYENLKSEANRDFTSGIFACPATQGGVVGEVARLTSQRLITLDECIHFIKQYNNHFRGGWPYDVHVFACRLSASAPLYPSAAAANPRKSRWGAPHPVQQQTAAGGGGGGGGGGGNPNPSTLFLNPSGAAAAVVGGGDPFALHGGGGKKKTQEKTQKKETHTQKKTQKNKTPSQKITSP